MAAAAGTAPAVVSGRPWWRRLTIRQLWFLVPVLAPIATVAGPIEDGSFLWHVRAGQVQSAAGEVLRSDPFSFTRAGEAWRTQSWLMELFYNALDALWSDLAWVAMFRLVVAGVIIAAVMIAVYRVTGSHVVTVLGGILTFWLGAAYFVPRPVIGSSALLAILVLTLHRRRSWAIVPLLWVWAAIHGSFVLGLGLVVLEAVRTRRRDLGELAVVGAVAASLTAHGLEVWTILFGFLDNREALEFISEWARPDLTRPELWPFAMVLVAIGVAAYRGGLTPRDLVVVVPFILFGFSSLRAVFPAFVVLMPYAAQAVSAQRSKRRPGDGSPVPAVIGVALTVAVVTVVAVAPPRLGDKFPVALVAELEAERLLHDEVTGGYLIYARDDLPVFIDDRAELYGPEFFAEFLAGEAGELDLASRYDIDQVLAENDSGFVELYRGQGWPIVAEGGGFTLLRRP